MLGCNHLLASVEGHLHVCRLSYVLSQDESSGPSNPQVGDLRKSRRSKSPKWGLWGAQSKDHHGWHVTVIILQSLISQPIWCTRLISIFRFNSNIRSDLMYRRLIDSITEQRIRASEEIRLYSTAYHTNLSSAFKTKDWAHTLGPGFCLMPELASSSSSLASSSCIPPLKYLNSKWIDFFHIFLKKQDVWTYRSHRENDYVKQIDWLDSNGTNYMRKDGCETRNCLELENTRYIIFST